MQQFVITIDDPHKTSPEWKAEDVHSAIVHFYVMAKDRGVNFRVEPYQSQLSLGIQEKINAYCNTDVP